MIINNHYIPPNWPAPKNVHAFSTTRTHGHSKAPFDSFNLGARVDDDATAINNNRNQLIQELNLPNPPVWLHQTHSINVIQAENPPTNSPADAAYSQTPNTVCVVLTADCLPILLCNRSGTKVAAVHAGWRGLVAGVIETTWNIMQIKPEDTLAWLGPAIGPTIFEVGDEVREQFVIHDAKAENAFTAQANQKWLANIYQLAKQRLAACKVTQIYGGDYCTYTQSDLFFSHRRDKGKTGRMASLIWFD